jgi:hypothetical protein
MPTGGMGVGIGMGMVGVRKGEWVSIGVGKVIA